uniref:Uncharacterized protein n=1 Tax=Fagus sylvatica TaxID=28930 RepID=A0A2N9HSD7_FAGSY
MAMSKQESEKVAKLSPAPELDSHFHKSKPATVIPAERKLVKTMMYECLVNAICSSCPSSSGPTKPCSCFKKNGKPVYPHTP